MLLTLIGSICRAKARSMLLSIATSQNSNTTFYWHFRYSESLKFYKIPKKSSLASFPKKSSLASFLRNYLKTIFGAPQSAVV